MSITILPHVVKMATKSWKWKTFKGQRLTYHSVSHSLKYGQKWLKVNQTKFVFKLFETCHAKSKDSFGRKYTKIIKLVLKLRFVFCQVKEPSRDLYTKTVLNGKNIMSLTSLDWNWETKFAHVSRAKVQVNIWPCRIICKHNMVIMTTWNTV